MKWKLNVARIQMGITISFIHFSGEYSPLVIVIIFENLKPCQCIDVGVLNGSFYLQDP